MATIVELSADDALDPAPGAPGAPRLIDLPPEVELDTVTTSPLQRPEGFQQRGPTGNMLLRNTMMSEEPGVSIPAPPGIHPTIIAAADSGVAFDRPAQRGQFLASLAVNRDEALKAYRIGMKEATGRNVEVRLGPKTGEIEYFDPDSKRWSLADPPGDQALTGYAGPAIVMVPEAIGGIVGALVMKTPLGADLGNGVGAFAGEIMRLKMGQALGINTDLTNNEILLEAAKTGGLSGAGGLAARKALQFGKFVIDAAEGRILDPRVIDALGIDKGDALRIASEINKTLGAEKLRFSLGQASNDPDILNLEEALKRNPRYNREFGEFTDDQRTALGEFWEAINKPYRSRLSTEDVGSKVKDIAQSKLDRTIAREDLFVAMKEAQLENALKSIRSSPHEGLGRQLRDVGNVEQEAFNKWARDAASKLNDIAGGSSFIQNTRTYDAVQTIGDKTVGGLLPGQEKAGKALIGEFGGSRGQVGGDQEIVRKIFDPDARFTFIEAWDAISYLKQLERVASKGLSTDAPQVGHIKMLSQALEQDLRAASQTGPLREAYDTFIQRYASEKRRLDDGIVADIMERRGGRNGRFVVADEDVFKTFFRPGGRTEALELKGLIDNDPQALQGVREAINDFYLRNVTEGGRVNLNKHVAFIRQYQGPLEEFFSKKEMADIARPGGIERALRAREEARKVALDNLNQTFEAKIANLNDPGQLVPLILDADNPSKARAVMGMLTDVPDVQRAVRAEVRKVMADRVAGEYKNGERVFSATRFADFLEGKAGERGHAATLREIYGSEYVDNLRVLNDALKLAAREAEFPNRSNSAHVAGDTLKTLARAYAGTFTVTGRVLTAANKLLGNSANRALGNAILDPEGARALNSLRGVPITDQKAISILGALGASALLEDYE